MNIKMKKRSHRYDINWLRSKHGQKYIKWEKCLSMMMLTCIRQYLSNIYEKALLIKKSCIYLLDVLACLRDHVLGVLACLMYPHAYVLACLACLLAYMLACLTCSACLRAEQFCFLMPLRVHMSCMLAVRKYLTCLRACMLRVLVYPICFTFKMLIFKNSS